MPDPTNSHPSQKITYIVKDQLKIVGEAWGSSENPVVLLAHGGGQTRHAWGNTAMKLAQKGWYVISLDLRGHGDSSWHPKGHYQIGTFAEDLRIIATTFNKPPAFVGASLGGISGLIAEGESNLNVFNSIILVDVAHRVENEGVDRILSFMGENMEKGFANLEEVKDVIAKYLPHRSLPTDFSGLEKNLRLGADGRYYWHWDPKLLLCANDMRRTSNLERYTTSARSLKIPTLFVRGLMSDVVSKDIAKEFLELVPHAKLADIQDAGHMVAGDKNDIFSDSIIEFLSKISKKN